MSVFSALTAIADAIRAKTGKTDRLTLDQMPTEIEGIQSGGGGSQEIYMAPSGALYTPVYDNGGVVPLNIYQWSSNLFRGADKLEEVTLRGWENVVSNKNGDVVTKSSVKKLFMPDFKATGLGAEHNTTYIAADCVNLNEVVLGGVGSGITGTIYVNAFRGCTNSDLVITIYTTAEVLANVPSGAPWGATNATVIYRNSITGEVITE